MGPRADELIGSYALPLPNLTKPENLVWDAEPAWYDISETSAEGAESKAGRVRLSLHWGPPAPEWGLRVVVFECRGLPRLSAFDKNDVKVQVKVEGDGVEKSKQHTTTIEDGGGDSDDAPPPPPPSPGSPPIVGTLVPPPAAFIPSIVSTPNF